MSDQFNLSGDFRGAVLNIKSTLTNAQQKIGEIRTENIEARQELMQLITQLSDELQKVPDAWQGQAEAVAETAKTLVEAVTKSEKTSKSLIRITSEGLEQAAKNLGKVLPNVITIAAQIVANVTKLSG
jgi:methyl-accepting chemotaxis protein